VIKVTLKFGLRLGGMADNVNHHWETKYVFFRFAAIFDYIHNLAIDLMLMSKITSGRTFVSWKTHYTGGILYI